MENRKKMTKLLIFMQFVPKIILSQFALEMLRLIVLFTAPNGSKEFNMPT